MKKLMSLLLTGITITNMVSGYPQKVHQHIVTQAKGLLVLEYPHINFRRSFRSKGIRTATPLAPDTTCLQKYSALRFTGDYGFFR